jgi:hypothetical protein
MRKSDLPHLGNSSTCLFSQDLSMYGLERRHKVTALLTAAPVDAIGLGFFPHGAEEFAYC